MALLGSITKQPREILPVDIDYDLVIAGRTVDSIIEQYVTTVRPAHDQFIEPTKRYADVIFPQGGMNDAATEMLLARVRELANIRAS